ncbi:MarR family winged helix-turn-helix transcriptional regulator [Streptomyces violaceorubidus]|uniref:MarR family winged helix-turn-helix transcriptional regulator n=1 Tax=Streptomyces violaceorubidus TaxID=284042 RepID=UPI000ADE8019|nr:MarR family transcriptional regulator [Streptomyces violaceorubidus]
MDVPTEGPGPHGPLRKDPDPDDLIIAAEEMIRYVRHSARTGGLSTAAASTLARLSREGPRRLTELARAEGVSQPNMTQLVTRLERAGLVRRAADVSDGRGVLVAVTPAGAEVLAARRIERARALGQLMEDMTGPERQATTTALLALARVIRNRPYPPEEDRA